MNREFDRICSIIDECRFPGYTFERGILTQDLFFIQVLYQEPDVMTGVVEDQRGRKWVIPAGSAPGQVAQTLLKALLTSLEHRCREHFLFRGRPVLQPHFDLDELWRLAAPHEYEGKPVL